MIHAKRMEEVELTTGELHRYARHLAMPEVGAAGQRRLKAARVLCIGAGGLGSPASLYLAAAGVGTIGLVDFDRVDSSNLQRQILYAESDVGRPKLAAAAERLRAMNSSITIATHETRFSAASALDLLARYDIVVDGTDNFATRYLVNDACVLARKPNVYGSIFRFEGQASVFAMPGGPCYRCLHPEPPPPGLIQNCAEGGVLGVLPGIIGTIQATEAIKLALGEGTPLVGRFLVLDALRMRFRELRLNRDPDCPVCGTAPTITVLRDYDEYCDGTTPPVEDEQNVTVEELKERMERKASFVLVDVREPAEHSICRIPGAQLIPLGELNQRYSEIPKDREVIVHCRSGVRSARAAHFLRGRGYPDVHNLEGGILAWIERVDPSLKRY
ncbi:MAG TPA: molybdopterin-synthase adenylyltransferase MoeB [Vicinamibacterales bacterium]|nr:molybdopterin-synthase adenylyltransferase MoeB [Vicinamibacterales bacterium]